jgi:hypothetical protein
MAVLANRVVEPKASWQRVFHVGIVPQLSTCGLLALHRALTLDDPALLQGATTEPPPLQAVQEWPVRAACALAYAGWQGDGLESVGEVEDFFARLCWEADKALGEPAAIRYFLNWFDQTERTEMRRLLLCEVEFAIAERRGHTCVARTTDETRPGTPN